MTRIIFLTFLTLFLVIKVTAQKNPLVDFPKVNLTISLLKDSFNSADDIPIKMVLTNNTKNNQKLLFDKPKSSTGGPAGTAVLLTNKKTGKSALKSANKRVLESQIYSEERLKDNYYNLGTGQLLKGEFSLFDLAITNLDNYRLEKGTYELQIFYYMNHSNILTFTIR